MHTVSTLASDSYLVELVEAVELARIAWRDTVNHLQHVSDEVWLGQMEAVVCLEIQYRTQQEQLCRYLYKTVMSSGG